MVLPGPGETQLIGYDPALPSADPTPEPEPDNIKNYAKDPNSNGTPKIEIHSYIVTFQVRVRASNPLHAQLQADSEGGELINCSAERLDE